MNPVTKQTTPSTTARAASAPRTPEALRADFPVLAREVHGKRLVYLDNAATTQKPKSVLAAMQRYYEHSNANVHRGIHALAYEATVAYEEAHEKVARFIGAPSMRNVVFTKNTTESLNTLAYGWGLRRLKKGDEVVTTQMEHHSNIVPWQAICKLTGATLKFLPVTPEGYLDLDAAESVITPRTKIVTVTHMSNVLGTINPVAEIGKLAHAVGAVFIVDGAQSVPHMPVDVKKLGCDFMAFSGHKMLGPTGIGVLYGTEDALTKLDPMLFGGEMIRKVTFEQAEWNELPWKFEAGTPVIAEGVGLGAAVDYLTGLGMEWVRSHEVGIVRYGYDKLSALDGLTIYGPPPQDRGAVLAFNMGNVHSHDLAHLLDEEGIAVRAGHHCAMPLQDLLGIPSSTRASMYIYNTKAEIDVLADALGKAHQLFG